MLLMLHGYNLYLISRNTARVKVNIISKENTQLLIINELLLSIPYFKIYQYI